MDNSWKDKIPEMKGDKISLKETCAELSTMLDKYEWFYDSIVEGPAITVYVDYMNRGIMGTIPEYLYGYHIKVAFSGYLLCGEKYGSKAKFPKSNDIEDDD